MDLPKDRQSVQRPYRTCAKQSKVVVKELGPISGFACDFSWKINEII